MMCLHPIKVRNKKKGIIVSVPCGRCLPCLYNRQQMWSIRLFEEDKVSTSAWFVTWTYEDEYLSFATDDRNIPFPIVVRKDVQDMLKRLRKKVYGSSKGALKYFICSEYGPQTLRPHYHGILFNLEGDKLAVTKLLQETWNRGLVTVEVTSPARIQYVAKYCTSYALLPDRYNKSFNKMVKYRGQCDGLRDMISEKYYPYRPFMLCSKRLGSFYFENAKRYDRNMQVYYYERNGYKKSLPRYYKDALYPPDSPLREKVSLSLNTYRNEVEQQMIDEFNKSASLFRTFGEYKQYVDNLRSEELKKKLLKVNAL